MAEIPESVLSTQEKATFREDLRTHGLAEDREAERTACTDWRGK